MRSHLPAEESAANASSSSLLVLFTSRPGVAYQFPDRAAPDTPGAPIDTEGLRLSVQEWRPIVAEEVVTVARSRVVARRV